MFLFNKKTRNIIKYIWGGLATLVVLSMIITYSGFTSLARTGAQQQQQPEQQIPPEVQAQLQAQKNGEQVDLNNTPEEQQVLKAIEEGRLNIDPNAPETAPTEGEPTQTPPSQTLELKI